ncbi:MAG: copper homeostasis membrane protein CopD [Bradyrhizobium sp.]|uniref:copper homeostasis membrane protein CopD n=1 Tax=Bradyrhizobium sp. TaxID=376 RepID=UPI001C2912C7|nr:copper homeostasis membrane protein CopD [Bradyrhizobium sp.]MBU6462054.1 copper homeostasis membrane protein CopD [Pseudomonadota bacterium]MDE2066449.1 copper homeostasis membrane protein CopD [Bradyrhizobium sp.]MDE2242588.1 copper homeostasis membrane protein CopD [Bradyrhizobium sp.]MDE2467280.1 copper homeostasis membrane protein CopD [Bradyrhizobium sp.]
MSWFGAEVNGPLVLTRAIHFAASATTAGAVMFCVFVADPALRQSRDGGAILQSRMAALTWTGLAVTAVTGLVWFMLLTMSITGLGSREAITSGAVLTVAGDTQFGLVSEVRAAFALVLAACLVLSRYVVLRWLGLAAASALVGAIAWTGHAGSTLGELGILHLTADVLHLLAASAWIGGLFGLSILFAVGRRRSAFGWEQLQLDAVLRFSALGMISIAVLILSGIVNTWILVGSFRALLVTDYGQLLLLKIVAFVLMVGFAAVNRFWLTPQITLTTRTKTHANALSALTRNTLIEIALGLAIFAIVGVLGTLHPAIHFMN